MEFLRVTNDLLMNADAGDGFILLLLDLSVTFDTVDRGILTNRLQQWVGICDTALQWFSAYLSDCRFWQIGDSILLFSPDNMRNMPQGSILGPTL